MIPSVSNFPETFDTNDNMFEVHDSLRMVLAEDYNPGDTSITVTGDPLTISLWPPTGLVTLTEQCSDINLRAISFYYSAFDSTNLIISGLEILDGFTDNVKLNRITNVTVNVMDKHHNQLCNALKAIQGFAGEQGLEDNQPFGDTLEGRINFLRQLVLQPKAWFDSDIQIGNVPLDVEFQNLSFRLATDGNNQQVIATWDFGDHTSSTVSLSTISADSMVPDSPIDVLVLDSDSGLIKKIYHQPGIYDVKLTVTNNFGSDTVIFPGFINARVKAPNPAIVRFVENTSNQESIAGVPPNGPFDTPPIIRSPINTLIQLEVESGENPSTPGFSYAGEPLNDSGDPIDPVVNWTWSLSDDLNHPNSNQTKASYSVGGFYNMKLRVDTSFGAYRITSYENSIDIVENTNLWLWIYQDETTVRAYEYGLISETFKLTAAPTLTVSRNTDFLTAKPNSAQQIAEFNRNVGFAPKSNVTSGQGGTAYIYWASGRAASDPASSEVIRVVEFDGFSGVYVNRPSITRQWNWANLNSPSTSYFVFGANSNVTSNQSPTNSSIQSMDLTSLTTASSSLGSQNYLNGAQELQQNVSIFDNTGASIYGDFSVYRTAWKDGTGYILRNDGVGPFFRIKSFYRTEGILSNAFINVRKLQDIQGPTKLEGELVPMSTSLFFLNNTGSVSSFNPTENVWRSGGPGVNSLLYRNLQDTSVAGYDSVSNTLLTASDGDKRAYLSFDYSSKAFLRFSEIDTTFMSLGIRPDGNQFLMGVY